MQNLSTEQASTVAFFLHVYIKCKVTNPIWARKIWPLRNEFSKSSTQAIYNTIVWKIFMHWTIVNMFYLSCCGVRRRLREYSFFLIYVLSIAFISLGCFFPCLLIERFCWISSNWLLRRHQKNFSLIFFARTLHKLHKICMNSPK